MSNLLGFSLGRLTETLNLSKNKRLFDQFKKIGISGIELTFATKERLYSCKIDDNFKRNLRKFKYVSLHSPFDLVREAKDCKEVIEQLDVLAKMYTEIRARNIIIHPDNLPPPEILSKYNFKVSTENLKKKHGFGVFRLKKILREYPKIGLCLDTAHAYSWSKHETSELIRNFKNRITQVHLSARFRGKDHQSLRRVSKNFLFSIASIKGTFFPIIIEEDIKTVNFKDIKDELNYFKKFLSD